MARRSPFANEAMLTTSSTERLPPWALKFRWRGPLEYVVENLSDSPVYVSLAVSTETDEHGPPQSGDPRIKVHRIQ